MKDIWRAIVGLIFYALAAAVFFWTASLNLSVAQLVLPNNNTPIMVLAIFDGGMVAWMLVFMFHAEGTLQRAISISIMGLDLLGIVIITLFALYLSGQTLTAVPENLGQYVLYCLELWTLFNVLAIVSYHLTSPKILTEIRRRSAQDKINKRAFELLDNRVDENALELAQEIEKGLYSSLLASMNLLTTGSVIEGKSTDVPTPEPDKVHVMALDTDEINPTQPPEPRKPRRK